MPEYSFSEILIKKRVTTRFDIINFTQSAMFDQI